MAKPQDLEWKFVRYNDPTKTLIASDWDVMKNVKQPDAEVEGRDAVNHVYVRGESEAGMTCNASND